MEMFTQTVSSNRRVCLKKKTTHGEHKGRAHYRGKVKQTERHPVSPLFTLLQTRIKSIQVQHPLLHVLTSVITDSSALVHIITNVDSP